LNKNNNQPAAGYQPPAPTKQSKVAGFLDEKDDDEEFIPAKKA
jgi:hypothetical protein